MSVYLGWLDVGTYLVVKCNVGRNIPTKRANKVAPHRRDQRILPFWAMGNAMLVIAFIHHR